MRRKEPQMESTLPSNALYLTLHCTYSYTLTLYYSLKYYNFYTVVQLVLLRVHITSLTKCNGYWYSMVGSLVGGWVHSITRFHYSRCAQRGGVGRVWRWEMEADIKSFNLKVDNRFKVFSAHFTHFALQLKRIYCWLCQHHSFINIWLFQDRADEDSI